jgi:hypothetical protein
MEEIIGNRVSLPLKRVLLVLLKLIGEDIAINTFNDLTQEMWELHREKMDNLQQKVVEFITVIKGNRMSIN